MLSSVLLIWGVGYLFVPKLIDRSHSWDVVRPFPLNPQQPINNSAIPRPSCAVSSEPPSASSVPLLAMAVSIICSEAISFSQG